MGLFDFIGDIFGGDTQVNIPGPSAEERRLQGLQAEQIERQNNMLNLLLPITLKNAGLEAVFGEVDQNKLASLDAQIAALKGGAVPGGGGLAGAVSGAANAGASLESLMAERARVASGNNQIVGVRERPKTPEELKRAQFDEQLLDLQLAQLGDPEKAKEIQTKLADRTLAALRGELPVDQGLLRTLSEEETNLREGLRKNLGSGFETSSPGIEALGDFSERKQSLLDAARRGDLTLAEQLSQSRSLNNVGQFLSSTDLSERIRGTRLGQISGLPGMFNAGIQNINPFLNREAEMRLGIGRLGLQSDMFNSQLAASTLFGIGDFAGTMWGPKGGRL